MHRQIKGIHKSIGMRMFTTHFSLEERQACPKTSGSKEIKEREEKQDSLLPGQLPITYLITN